MVNGERGEGRGFEGVGRCKQEVLSAAHFVEADF